MFNSRTHARTHALSSRALGVKRRRLRFEQLELRCLLSANPGDFSGNALVDAADYVLFRKGDPRADSNGDNVIDQTDYSAWRSNFGNAYLPGAFQITGPTNHLLTDNDFTVSWTASANATSYRLRISTSPDLSTIYDQEDLTTTSRQFTGFAEAQFYIGVTAVNAGGSTTASNQAYPMIIDLPETKQLIFVSSYDYYINPFSPYPPDSPGEFRGPEGADWQLTNLADAAGLLAQPWDGESIHFRAMITESLTDLFDRAQMANGDYFNTRGELVAHSTTEMFAGNFLAPIYDEYGNAVSGVNVPVWTGAYPDGSWNGLTKNDWTSFGTATIGRLNGAGTTWISFGTRSGDVSAFLYGVGVVEVMPHGGSFTTIARSGSANPTTQGFTTTTFEASSTVGPISNDSGHAAWSIAGTAQSSQFGYAKTLSAANDTALHEQGFIMSFDARAVQGLAPVYDAINHVAVAAAKVDVNNRRYEVDLGIDANGDTVVILPSSIDNAGPGGSTRAPGASYTLVGSGSSWHNYQLVFSDTTQTAYLLVDGVKRFLDYTGHTSGVSSIFGFGAMSGGQANFDGVKLELLNWPSNSPGAGSGASAPESIAVSAPRTNDWDLSASLAGSTGGSFGNVLDTPVARSSARLGEDVFSGVSSNAVQLLLAQYVEQVDGATVRAVDEVHSLGNDDANEPHGQPENGLLSEWEVVAEAISL